MELTFEPISAESINELESWFDDSATRRHLGDRSWLVRTLTLVEEAPSAEFRGRRVLGRHIWVVRESGRAVALVDVEPYDDGTAGIALVVAPSLRGKGFGRRVLESVRQRPELSRVQEFIGAIEPGNVAARRCASRARYAIADREDDEGLLRISLRNP